MASPPLRLGLSLCRPDSAEVVRRPGYDWKRFTTRTGAIPNEPPLPVLCIATPPVTVKLLVAEVDVVGTFDPLTFFIWLRT
jgi:hypothetical protein